ncbi:MAG: methyltransferase domain-containing protein [Euryarchaeota archaeon]|nr:methyltransferase domain-containing protein [Euryarchaeota archaeon]
MVDDKTAEEFAAYMKKFIALYEYLASVVQRHSSTSHPFILDLGAGPGLLSVEIFRKIPQATIIGIDPLIKMLQLAKGNVKNADFQTFEPVVGVSENIPLKNNTVDVITSRFSLPYWTQPNKSFEEMTRVLKPGGKVILEALNRDFPTWKLLLIKIRMLFNRAGRDVTRYHVDAYKLAHTIEQVEQFFTDAGFTISEKEGKKNQWRFIIVAEKK